MALPNTSMDAVPFTPLTAEFLDDMIENIEYLGDILDGTSPTGPDGWNLLSALNPTVTHNGNRSYSVVYSSVNYTSLVSPGARLKFSRTVTPPSQCADLESSSSQYFNKTSPTGMTFTDDFVAGAWVKLESYTGAVQVIASRYNGTSGWLLYLTASGQVALQGNNGGGTNLSSVTSFQSIPLNKWVYIAGQLDMSAFTATPTTSYIMIDGVDVPCTVARGGTNPTALIQAGNLEIGSTNSGTSPFDGKIAQAFVSSAKITQANVRTLYSQGLTASLISTHSIVSAYDFNGNSNDLNTTNANNLTAQNSAAATATDSPFNSTEYGIVMAASFSTNTTLTVQVPEGFTLPTSGGISSASYSSQKVPYGFPSQRGKWVLRVVNKASQSQTSPGAGTWYNLGLLQLNLPIGDWKLGYECGNVSAVNNSAAATILTTLSTTNNSETDYEFTTRNVSQSASANSFELNAYRSKDVSVSSATPYYFNAAQIIGAGSALTINGGNYASTVIFAENAHI